MKKILCAILGHWVGELSVGLAQAKCGRCLRTYHAHYDMSYGETVFDKLIEKP